MLKVSSLADGRKAISLPDEEWKEFPEDPRYLVSNFGRVYGPRGFKKATPNKGGHLIIAFWLQGRHKGFVLSRIVCELFNGPAPKDKPLALHTDHNPSNNRADNLHWGSHRDNADEMIAAGRSSAGPKNNQAKLTWEKVREIRTLHTQGNSCSDLGLLFRVSGPTISSIVNNKSWKESTHA